jgi:hypothetical protein
VGPASHAIGHAIHVCMTYHDCLLSIGTKFRIDMRIGRPSPGNSISLFPDVSGLLRPIERSEARRLPLHPVCEHGTRRDEPHAGERRYREESAGPQRSTMPERRGPNGLADEEA